ncbi:MAG TPA: tRNA (adenosine(37)-N6)-threonylcarbamoyltransferase complex transferase subunit TsaD [Flavobacteriales bacterium]|nr:tRNA (adenosine(37)-N6)-threonylcarbamoyltransferase complex transferase subunit TsaD [Flavobacteriales bacterium]
MILGIESSCDETSAAIVINDHIRSNRIANQTIHQTFGGVVPELASRAHQANVIPVIDTALKDAKLDKSQLTAIAYTQGPGLMGALMVGSAVAKSMAMSLGIPLIPVNHMQAHILAHFIKKTPDQAVPSFPFLCLTVSGGHTQLVLVKDHLEMEIIGQTIDDAAGEAFDKCAKILGLPYPGGPLIDKLAVNGNINAFSFAEPKANGFDFSFSGLKTSFLYFIQKKVKENPNFIEENKADLCASIQHTIVKILLDQFEKAAKKLNVKDVCIAGGVSANSYLRNGLKARAEKNNWNCFIPEFEFCTDNAAMIAITGYFKYLKNQTGSLTDVPMARMEF